MGENLGKYYDFLFLLFAREWPSGEFNIHAIMAGNKFIKYELKWKNIVYVMVSERIVCMCVHVCICGILAKFL